MAPLNVAPDSTCVPPPITTTATPGGSSNLPGTAQHDTVTVNDGTNAGVGTVKFFLCSPSEVTANGGDCKANGTQIGSAVTLDANGNGTSANVNGSSTPNDNTLGRYCWRAEFTPGPNDHHYLAGSHTNSGSECFTVIKASPAVSTQASKTDGGVVGTDTTSDTATLSGGLSLTGTVTFTLKAPDGSTSTVATDTVTGDGTYNAGPVAITQVGTYTWHASYSGDSLNNGAVDNGDNESVTSVKASPSVSTQASKTDGGVVGTGTTSDTATVSGGDNPTGTIQFSIKKPDGTTSNVGSPVPVSGDGTYNAPSSVQLTQVGTYTWSASYSGDSLNNGAVDNGDNESVTSIKASPSVSTQASKTDGGVVGTGTTSDTATVSGGDNPTGTITFTLKAPDGTTSTIATDTVAGDGSYSAGPVSLTEVGTYTWHASYSGDSLNSGAVDNGDNESVSSVKASPSVSTQASVTGAGVVGTDTTSDTATVSGGDDPTGTITFTLKAPDGTTSTIATDTVAGDGSYSAGPVSLTEVGTYTWHASYSGDSLNSGAVDNGDNESVTTGKASPAVSTQASKTNGGVVGTGTTCDMATISGGVIPTGTITFTLTAPDNTTVQVGAPVLVMGDGIYDSPSCPSLTEFGTYTWHASYSGDSLNSGAVDNGDNESVTSVKASPSVSTQASKTDGGVVGTGTTSDTATVSGGDNPTGTITFTLKAPDGTTSTVATDTVTGDGTYKAGPVAITQVGTYTWHAGYSGDSLNNGAVDNGDNESVTSIKASPSVSTQASVTGAGVVGTGTTSDTATVSGGDNPTGTITFTLKAPDGTTSTIATDTVAGDGSYSAGPVSLTEVGTYTWHASYSGDSLNSGAVDNGDNESVSSVKASPSVSTQASVTGNGVVGTDSTSDTATVTGGDDPTGTIQFSIKAPDGTSSNVGLPVTVTGDGTYDSPSSVSLTEVGTYTWHATYSGNGLNNGAADNGNNESVTTGLASPSLSTQASVTGNGVVGTDSTSDTATVTGGDDPTGTIQFSIKAPDGTSSNVGLPVTVTGDGTYDSPSSVPLTEVGTYTWHATYSGDSLNDGASDNSDNESVTSIPASPSITTVQDPASGSTGDTFKDKATLSGTFQPDGSITWNLYPSDECTAGTSLETETVPVDADGTYETPTGIVLNTPGTYYWVASFNDNSGNNNTASTGCTDEPVVVRGAAIHILKTADAAKVNVGDPIGFTVAVWNSGDGDAHGVKLNDSLPTDPGLSWTIDKTGAGWASSCAITAGVLTCGGSNGVTVPAGTTQANSTFTVHITSTTAAAAGGDCPGSGTVDNVDAKVTTTNAGSADATASTCVQALVDLSITKTGSPATQELGQGNITWTMVVKNNGPDADTGVKITDPMPGGNTFVSATTTQGTCTGGAILTCNIGDMAAGATVTITLVTTPSVEGTQTNTVTVSGNRPETNTTNNTATATVNVFKGTPPVFCVAVSKVTPKQLFVGRKTMLTIHLTKNKKAVSGVHVRIKGPKLNIKTKASNGTGVIKQSVKMKKAGVLIFTPIASKTCNTKRVGVTNVFTPPVTG